MLVPEFRPDMLIRVLLRAVWSSEFEWVALLKGFCIGVYGRLRLLESVAESRFVDSGSRRDEFHLGRFHFMQHPRVARTQQPFQRWRRTEALVPIEYKSTRVVNAMGSTCAQALGAIQRPGAPMPLHRAINTTHAGQPLFGVHLRCSTVSTSTYCLSERERVLCFRDR